MFESIFSLSPIQCTVYVEHNLLAVDSRLPNVAKNYPSQVVLLFHWDVSFDDPNTHWWYFSDLNIRMSLLNYTNAQESFSCRCRKLLKEINREANVSHSLQPSLIHSPLCNYTIIHILTYVTSWIITALMWSVCYFKILQLISHTNAASILPWQYSKYHYVESLTKSCTN